MCSPSYIYVICSVFKSSVNYIYFPKQYNYVLSQLYLCSYAVKVCALIIIYVPMHYNCVLC